MFQRWCGSKRNENKYSPVRVPSTVDQFLGLLLCSELASFSEVQNACAGFDTSRRDEQALNELCEYLVERKVLTKWQCGKLRSGKWKGFVDGGYRFRSLIKTEDSKNSVMSADRISTGERVAVKVTRLKAPPWIRYTVVKEVDPPLLLD
jgi:hypothetical protein